jgi:hypothetical protein
VPAAVFTEPQIATVGAREQDLSRECRYVAAVQEYADVAYGWALQDTTGFCKLYADAASGTRLGAHIMGYQASLLIEPLVQAAAAGQRVADLAGPVLDPPRAQRGGGERAVQAPARARHQPGRLIRDRTCSLTGRPLPASSGGAFFAVGFLDLTFLAGSAMSSIRRLRLAHQAPNSGCSRLPRSLNEFENWVARTLMAALLRPGR